MDDALIGTWQLVTHHIEDRATGARIESFGADPAGVLIILPGGRMSALITPNPSAPPPSAGCPAPLVAYSGHCRVPSPGRFVTAVDIASIAAWVGTEQERSYTIGGDRLTLSTAPARMRGANDQPEARVGIMVWVRETTTVASHGASD